MAQTEILRLRAGGAQDFACWLPLTRHAGSLTPAERLNLKSAAFKRGVGVRVPLSAHLPDIFQRSQGSLSQFQSAAPLTLLSLGNVCNEKTWNTIAPRKVL